MDAAAEAVAVACGGAGDAAAGLVSDETTAGPDAAAGAGRAAGARWRRAVDAAGVEAVVVVG